METSEKASRFCLVLLLLLAPASAFQVSSSPSTILQTAQLRAELSISISLTAGSYFEITLPAEVSITAGSISGCFEALNSYAITCSASGQVLTITLTTNDISAFTALRFFIPGFVNPSSTQPTSLFSVTSFTSAGASVESSSVSSNPALTATADQITGKFYSLTPVATFVTQNNVVGATAEAILTFTTKNAIPANGKVTLTFPEKWNPGAGGTALSYFTDSLTCTGITNVDVGASCSLSGDTLTLQNAFLAQIPIGSDVSFRVASVRNPRSAKSITGLTLSTRNSGNFDIDSSSGVSFTGTSVAASFDSITLNPTTTTQVGLETNMQIVATLNSIPVDAGAYVVLTYPADLPLSSQPITSIFASGSYNDPDPANIAVSGQSQTLPSLVITYQSALNGNIAIRQITNPTSTKPIDSFVYTLYDSSNNVIALKDSGITYTPTSGTLQSLAISADSTEVFATTTWQFTFTLLTSLVQDSQIRITLPAEVGANAGSCAALTNTNGVTNPSATCEIAGSVITVKNPFQEASGASSSTVLSFKLATGTLVNPITTAAIGSILFETRTPASSGQYVVDTATISNPFTLTTGLMTSASVTASPDMAYSTSTLTLSMNSGHPYPANAKILITIPSELQITNTAVATTSCASISASLSGMECSALSTTQIQILTKLTAASTPAATVYSFSMGGIRTQRTTASSSSFSFSVSTEDGAAGVETRTSGVFLLLTQVQEFSTMSITPSTFVNSASATYTFSVTTPTLLMDGDIVKLTPQSEVSNPTSLTPTCAGVSSNTLSATCALNGNVVQATLTFQGGQLVSGSSFQFSVSGYTNPQNTDPPTSNFSVLTQASSGANVAQYTSTLQVQTTTAATMQSHSSIAQLLVTSSLVPSFTTTTYTFSARTVSTTPQNSVLRVYVPNTVVVNSSPAQACTGDGAGLPGSLTCSYNSGLGYFEITDAFSSLTSYPARDFTLAISNLQNPPTATPTTSFKLETRTSSGGLIDSLNDGMTVTMNCNAPCATCTLGQPDTCLSCITNLAPSGSAYLLEQQSCVTSCSTSYLANTAGTACDACTSNCHTCQNSLSFCTSCTGVYSLKNNQCIQQCGDGFFASNNQCLACDSSTAFCATCSTAADVCQSCISGKVLQGSSCLDSCSTGYVANTSTSVCEQCTGNCLRCELTVDNCIECGANFFNFGGTCVGSCPTDFTTIEDAAAKTCTACDSTCATCITTTTTCLTCQTGLFKYNTSCLSTCPAGTTVPVGDTCQDCSLTCATCQTSTTNCLSCPANTFLITNTDGTKTCAANCPTDQYVSGTECVSCPSGQQLNSDSNGCVTIPGGTSGAQVEFVIFPFLLVALTMLILALASKLYRKQSYFFSNVVLLWGFIETVIIAFQMSQALIFGSTLVWVITAAALAFLLLCNLLIGCIYCRKMLKDAGFIKVKRRRRHCYNFMACLAIVWNFRIIRLHYSRFFGADIFQQHFQNFQNNFAKPLGAITILSVITVSLPIVILDLAAVVFWLPWGYQLTITCIESLIIQALLLVWIALEFKAFRDSEFDDKYYEEVGVIDNLEEQDRLHLLREIIKKIPQRDGLQGGLKDQDVESAQTDDAEVHAAEFLNERAERRRVCSYPPSPRTVDEKVRAINEAGGFEKALVEPFSYPDNVYAESEVAQPLKRKGKKFITSCTQTHRKKRRKVVNEYGDLETIWETDSGSEYDEDEEAQLMRENLAREAEERQREEALREMQLAEKTQKQIESEIKKVSEGLEKRIGEQAEIINVMLVAQQEKARQEEEERLRQQEERKRVEQARKAKEEELLVMEQLEPQPMMEAEAESLDPESARDVMGDNDHIEMAEAMAEHQFFKRRTSLLEMGSTEQLPVYEEVEKYSLAQHTVPGGGTPIGEPEEQTEAVLYPQLENLEFAPNYIDIDEIRGDFMRDEKGNVVITKNDAGVLVDRQGRRVNRLGYLVDEEENVIDGNGQRVEIIGDFEKDGDGNFKIIPDPTVPFSNGRANYLDKQGRPVNEKGYLIDREEGHVMDVHGAIVAKKGELEFDAHGQPVLLYDKNGLPIDLNGRRVNRKGYLTDNDGNLLNDENRVTIVNEELSSDEELPELIPTEKTAPKKMLQDEEDEQLMKKIEAHAEQGKSGDVRASKDFMAEEVEHQLHKMRPGSGSTSVNSDMDATPSSFNIMNQRFEQPKMQASPHFHPDAPQVPEERKSEEEDDLEDEGESDEDEEDEDAQYAHITQPRRLKPKRYLKPGASDRKLALAYGGQPRGPPIRRKMKTESSRQAFARPARGGSPLRQHPSKLENLTSSVTGLGYRRPQSGVHLESSLMTAPGGRGFSMESPSPLRDTYHQAQGPRGRKGKKTKKGKRIPPKRPDSRNSELEKIYGKVDDLESSGGSDYTIFSNASRNTSRSRLEGFKKIKGLETIYLQRLDPARSTTNMRRSGAGAAATKKSFSATPNKVSSQQQRNRSHQPKFRDMQDRFNDDPNFLATESEKEEYSMMSENYKQLSKLNTSSRAPSGFNTTAGAQSANMFHSNFRSSPRGKWM